MPVKWFTNTKLLLSEAFTHSLQIIRVNKYNLGQKRNIIILANPFSNLTKEMPRSMKWLTYPIRLRRWFYFGAIHSVKFLRACIFIVFRRSSCKIIRSTWTSAMVLRKATFKAASSRPLAAVTDESCEVQMKYFFINVYFFIWRLLARADVATGILASEDNSWTTNIYKH